MSDRIVDIESRRPIRAPGQDFWFAQVDLRLTRIETMIERLERTLWLMAWAAGAVLALEALRALIGA